MNLDERIASVCDIGKATVSETLYSTYFLRGSTQSQHLESCTDMADLNKQTDINTRLAIDRIKTYPRVVFLGTVSSTPGPYRNSTSILVYTKYVKQFAFLFNLICKLLFK